MKKMLDDSSVIQVKFSWLITHLMFQVFFRLVSGLGNKNLLNKVIFNSNSRVSGLINLPQFWKSLQQIR